MIGARAKNDNFFYEATFRLLENFLRYVNIVGPAAARTLCRFVVVLRQLRQNPAGSRPPLGRETMQIADLDTILQERSLIEIENSKIATKFVEIGQDILFSLLLRWSFQENCGYDKS